MPDPHRRSRNPQMQMTFSSRSNVPDTQRKYAPFFKPPNRHMNNPRKERGVDGGERPGASQPALHRHRPIAPKPSASEVRRHDSHGWHDVQSSDPAQPGPQGTQTPSTMESERRPHASKPQSRATTTDVARTPPDTSGAATSLHGNRADSSQNVGSRIDQASSQVALVSSSSVPQSSQSICANVLTSSSTKRRTARYTHGRWDNDMESFIKKWEMRRHVPSKNNRQIKVPQFKFPQIQKRHFKDDTVDSVKGGYRRNYIKVYKEWCKRYQTPPIGQLDDLPDREVRPFLQQLLAEQKAREAGKGNEQHNSQSDGPVVLQKTDQHAPKEQPLTDPSGISGQTTLYLHGFNAAQVSITGEPVYTKDGRDKRSAASGPLPPRQIHPIVVPSSDSIEDPDATILESAQHTRTSEEMSEVSFDEFPVTGSEADVLSEAALRVESSSAYSDLAATNHARKRAADFDLDDSKSCINRSRPPDSHQSSHHDTTSTHQSMQLRLSASPTPVLSSSPPHQTTQPSRWDRNTAIAEPYDFMTPCPAAAASKVRDTKLDESIVQHGNTNGQLLPTPIQTSPARDRSTQRKRDSDARTWGRHDGHKATTGPHKSSRAPERNLSARASQIKALQAEIARLRNISEPSSSTKDRLLKRPLEEEDVEEVCEVSGKRQRLEPSRYESTRQQQHTAVSTNQYSARPSQYDDRLPSHQRPPVRQVRPTAKRRNNYTDDLDGQPGHYDIDEQLLAGLAGSAYSPRLIKSTLPELEMPKSDGFTGAVLSFFGSIGTTLRAWFPSE